MGGAVAVTVRDYDGEIHHATRWTNSLTYWFQVPHFFQGDKEHLENWIARKGQQYDEKQCATLAPDCYGIVVVDCKNKIIISCQGYCHMSMIGCSSIWLDLNADYRDPRDDERCRVYNSVKEFQRLGWLWTSPSRCNAKWTKVSKDFDIKKDVLKDGVPSIREYMIKPPGWTIWNLPDTKQGFKVAKRLIERYFTLTDEEQQEWKDWLNELDDYDE